MKELYFVRHGQTEWNAIHRMQGQWNSDLSALGRQQADLNGQFLSGQQIDALYVSPLTRTQQTAEIVNRYLSLPIQLDDRIMEWDCGDWSGHMYADVKVKWPSEWAALEADRFNYRGPNCENYPDMIARSKPFLDELMATDEQRIAIVSHGMIGRAMVAQLLDISSEDFFSFQQDNDVIFKVTVNDGETQACYYIAGDGPIAGLYEG